MAKEEIGILLLNGTTANWINERVGAVVASIFGQEIADDIRAAIGRRKATIKRLVQDESLGRDIVENSPLGMVIRTCWFIRDASSDNPNLTVSNISHLRWPCVEILCEGFPSMTHKLVCRLLDERDTAVHPAVLASLVANLRRPCYNTDKDRGSDLTLEQLVRFYRQTKTSLFARQYMYSADRINTGFSMGTSPAIIGEMADYITQRYAADPAATGTIGEGFDLQPKDEDEYSECRNFIRNMHNIHSASGVSGDAVEGYARSALRERFPFSLPDEIDANMHTPEVNIRRAADFLRECSSNARTPVLSEIVRVLSKAYDIVINRMPERNVVRNDVMTILSWAPLSGNGQKIIESFATFMNPDETELTLWSIGTESHDFREWVVKWCEEHGKTLIVKNITVYDV